MHRSGSQPCHSSVYFYDQSLLYIARFASNAIWLLYVSSIWRRLAESHAPFLSFFSISQHMPAMPRRPRARRRSPTTSQEAIKSSIECGEVDLVPLYPNLHLSTKSDAWISYFFVSLIIRFWFLCYSRTCVHHLFMGIQLAHLMFSLFFISLILQSPM
jgi:hypothetical protein